MGHYRRASAKLIKLWGRSVRNFGFLCETENNLWKPRIFQLLVNDHNTDESVHFVNEIVSNNGSSEDGFVLIEILSALLVLAIAVITFLYVSRDTIYHTQNANEYEQAYDLAQSSSIMSNIRGFQTIVLLQAFTVVDLVTRRTHFNF